MISKKMQAMVNSSSAIRAMFEEGKRLASLWGEDKVFDFSLGNPNIARGRPRFFAWIYEQRRL